MAEIADEIMNTKIKTLKSTERFNINEKAKNEQINEPLSHFSVEQKNSINNIIEKRYDMLKNLSK
jgi:ABC-type xylose transport system substrate-binding protein